MFEEIISNYLMEILGVIMSALAGYIAVVVKNKVVERLNDETKRAVAKTVVQFVEQVYKDLHGADKLNAALTTCSEMLAEKGITVSELEMRALIEATVAEFNEVFYKADLTE